LFSFVPGAAEDGEKAVAMIVTNLDDPQACLSAVVIREIDGEPVTVSHRAFELAPGRHRMNGMANINTAFCPVADGAPGRAVPDLEAEFEAGRTYYVGLDHSAPDRSGWALVIWRVEQDGVRLFPSMTGTEAGELPD
jgi:hypothetical protein